MPYSQVIKYPGLHSGGSWQLQEGFSLEEIKWLRTKALGSGQMERDSILGQVNSVEDQLGQSTGLLEGEGPAGLRVGLGDTSHTPVGQGWVGPSPAQTHL